MYWQDGAMKIWQWLASIGLTTALVWAGVAWFLKTSYSHHLFEKMLKERNKHEDALQRKAHDHEKALADESEKLKSQLRRAGEREIEEVKAQLALEGHQQHLVFAQLHEHRVTALSEVHKALGWLHLELGRLIAPFRFAGFDAQAQAKLVFDRHKELEAAFIGSRLFLPRDVVTLVAQLQQTFISMTNLFHLAVRPESDNPDAKRWVELTEKFESEVKTTLAKLEEDMRIALGDKPPAMGNLAGSTPLAARG